MSLHGDAGRMTGSVWPAALWGGLAALVVLGGCSVTPREVGPPSLPAPAPASPAAPLPRDNLSVADRAAWRPYLRWSDDCEEAFLASHAGDDGGLVFTALGGGVSLVEVLCAAGAYQPSMERFRLVDDAGAPTATRLTFEVYTSEDGTTLDKSLATEVWGTSIVDGPRREMALLAIARQTGDCGVWTRYSLAEPTPRIIAAAARVECPATPGASARLGLTEPPAGWRRLP